MKILISVHSSQNRQFSFNIEQSDLHSTEQIKLYQPLQISMWSPKHRIFNDQQCIHSFMCLMLTKMPVVSWPLMTNSPCKMSSLLFCACAYATPHAILVAIRWFFCNGRWQTNSTLSHRWCLNTWRCTTFGCCNDRKNPAVFQYLFTPPWPPDWKGHQ